MKTKQIGVSAILSKDLVNERRAKTLFNRVFATSSKDLINERGAKTSFNGVPTKLIKKLDKKLNRIVFILLIMLTKWGGAYAASCPSFYPTNFIDLNQDAPGTSLIFRPATITIGNIRWQLSSISSTKYGEEIKFNMDQIMCMRLMEVVAYVWYKQPGTYLQQYDINIYTPPIPYQGMQCTYHVPAMKGYPERNVVFEGSIARVDGDDQSLYFKTFELAKYPARWILPVMEPMIGRVHSTCDNQKQPVREGMCDFEVVAKHLKTPIHNPNTGG